MVLVVPVVGEPCFRGVLVVTNSCASMSVHPQACLPTHPFSYPFTHPFTYSSFLHHTKLDAKLLMQPKQEYTRSLLLEDKKCTMLHQPSTRTK